MTCPGGTIRLCVQNAVTAPCPDPHTVLTGGRSARRPHRGHRGPGGWRTAHLGTGGNSAQSRPLQPTPAAQAPLGAVAAVIGPLHPAAAPPRPTGPMPPSAAPRLPGVFQPPPSAPSHCCCATGPRHPPSPAPHQHPPFHVPLLTPRNAPRAPQPPPTPLTVPLRHRDPLDSPQLPRRKCRKCPSPSPPPIGQLVGRARRLAERRGHAPRPCQQERGAQDGGGGCEGHRGRLGPQPAGAPRPSVPALGRQPRRQVSPGSAAGEGRRLLYEALTACPPLAGSSSSSTT